MKKMGGKINNVWRKLSYKVGRKMIKVTSGRMNQASVKVSSSRCSFRFLKKPKTATVKPAKNKTQTGSVNWIVSSSGIYEVGRSLAGYLSPLKRTKLGQGCRDII